MAKRNTSKTNEFSVYIKWMWRIFLGTLALICMLMILIMTGVIGYMPEIDELENPNNKFASEIYSSDQKVLGRYFESKENRVWVNYDQLSPHLIKALIATEDQRFYSHSGIDVIALGRAFVKRGLLFQKSAGGGSTISQQLAKLLYSPQANNAFERLFQKPIEWLIAIQLERFYTKEEIITMYLNKFDFLYNAVGIKSAANIYFSKEPSELSIEQAAMLIGMCKNPSYFNPVRRPERTLGRRNVVLMQMEKDDAIDESQYEALSQLPLELSFKRQDHKYGLAPYFREYLRGIMMAKKPSRSEYASWQKTKYIADSLAWEKDPLYGWCNKNTKANGESYNLYVDGLKIYTTINSKMQQYAEEAVAEHIGGFLQKKFFEEKAGKSYAPFARGLSDADKSKILGRAMKQSERYRALKSQGMSESEIKKVFGQKIDMQVFSWAGVIDTTLSPMDSILYNKHFLHTGLVSMDPYSGQVKAYVGGINYAFFQYDMAMGGRRQVGSTIKPYLYALAMENGFTPCDQTLNVQTTYTTEDGQSWTPRNSSKARVGEMVSLKWGLTNSNNWISAWIMNQLNPYTFVSLLRSVGVKGFIDPVMSLCLGPCEISVGEMVSGYSCFVNRGQRVEPLFVSRIEDSQGNLLAEFSPQRIEVISEKSSFMMLDMLQGVVNEGTGGRLRGRYGLRSPIGGKTGTTNNNADGWFMGFTPSLVTGVWVGGEDRSIHFDRMSEGQGAAMALPIWAIYMKKVFADSSLGYSEKEPFASSPYPGCSGEDQDIKSVNTSVGDLFNGDF